MNRLQNRSSEENEFLEEFDVLMDKHGITIERVDYIYDGCTLDYPAYFFVGTNVEINICDL